MGTFLFYWHSFSPSQFLGKISQGFLGENRCFNVQLCTKSHISSWFLWIWSAFDRGLRNANDILKREQMFLNFSERIWSMCISWRAVCSRQPWGWEMPAWGASKQNCRRKCQLDGLDWWKRERNWSEFSWLPVIHILRFPKRK